MAASHPCAVPGCTAAIGTDRLMCLPHWRQVPKAARAEIRESWRDLQAVRGRGVEAVLAALPRYRAATQAAVAALAPSPNAGGPP